MSESSRHADLPSGVSSSLAFEFSSPIFLLATRHHNLLPGPSPATVDAELDLSGLPVIAVRYVINEALLGGGPSHEFAPACYLRYRSHDRVFDMTYWNAGEESYRVAIVDPWEREEAASIGVDEALDDLGYLDREDPTAPVKALDLTFGVLSGWFMPGPISLEELSDWESHFISAERERRGAWNEGPAPWSR